MPQFQSLPTQYEQSWPGEPLPVLIRTRGFAGEPTRPSPPKEHVVGPAYSEPATRGGILGGHILGEHGIQELRDVVELGRNRERTGGFDPFAAQADAGRLLIIVAVGI